MKPTKSKALVSKSLVNDLREIIAGTRRGVAQAVNASLVMLYWQVGQRIRGAILQDQRASYGREIVATVSRQLEREFGVGFSAKNLHRMIQFVEAFPGQKIVATLSQQFGWSHFKEIIPLENDLQRKLHEAAATARAKLKIR